VKLQLAFLNGVKNIRNPGQNSRLLRLSSASSTPLIRASILLIPAVRTHNST
jgi:hypothetical protein